MSKIKAIIIDDEKSARQVLEILLKKFSEDVELLASASSLMEGITLINELQPDVVFLDVEMPKFAGYEIVNFFEKINFKIIFTTAYDRYAIKAFELSAIDYLLKPINRERLQQAIDKSKNLVKSEKLAESYHVLMNNINQSTKKMIISEQGSRKVLDLNEIIAVEGDGAYSHIYLSDDSKITVSRNLKSFEGSLDLDSGFYRSHKSWIINLKKVKEYYPSHFEILLSNGIVSKLSKTKRDEFSEVLTKV